MLSAHEQRQLVEIERWFTASDPVLADVLRDGRRSPLRRHRKLVAFAGDVLGALLVVLGAVTGTFSLIFAGIVALTVAACMHVTR
jgi:hypothetical protein